MFIGLSAYFSKHVNHMNLCLKKKKVSRHKSAAVKVAIKVAIKVTIKVVILLEKFREKQSIQEFNFRAIWGFQI